jgi:CheY-like chemotaxis protein/predicted regulator of Ras-like GTPase activity (Roadblock/LC7/MglB family)
MKEVKKRVLVVDDEDDLTWSISKHLAKDKDKYDLICVNSGKKALEVLSQLPVALVVSDIRMPEISGLDLLIKIKDFYPTTKVVIMTAYGSSEVHEEANSRGCLKYIEKPFEINELRQIILEVIEEKKGFKGTITDFHLSDLIQMNCLGRMTSCLYVNRDESEGKIYFSEGNLIHAECDDLEGEEAFYEMLSWEGGGFSTKRGEEAAKETIIKGWQSLLLEGMRRVDEANPDKKSSAAERQAIMLKKMSDILDKIIAIKEVVFATLFDPEGFPVASKMSDKYDISEITPIISNLIRQSEQVGQDMKLSAVKHISVEFENGLLSMENVPGKKEFLVFLSENANAHGVIKLKAKKYLRELSKLLN